jgi:menaquinol-cytochrome c reductase cytochrome b subunit
MATLPAPGKVQAAVVDWFDRRFPLTKAVDEALYQRVPNYANAFYYCFGGMVFILVVLQLVTGVFLSFYYVPDAASVNGAPAPAYTSVNTITNDVYLGWLVRGVHFWSASLLVVMIVLHMARVFWTGSYRAPRELNWMVGVILLGVILAFSLTGYLLPWDTKAYWATSVTIQIIASAPVVGGLVQGLVQGGPTLGPDTLQRFFTIHVFILPALVLLLMYVHFRLIRHHGVSEPL